MRKSLILFVFLLSAIVSCNKIEWSDAFKKNKTENSVKSEEKRDAGTKKITISAEPDRDQQTPLAQIPLDLTGRERDRIRIHG